MKSAVYQKLDQSAIERWATAAAKRSVWVIDPVGQDAAAAAAGHPQLLGIGDAALDQLVDAGHQVLVVVARDSGTG